MHTIVIVDTSICSANLGDEIIMDAVNAVVWELFPQAYIYHVPSHEPLSDRTRRYVRQASWCFIGGTNLLSSDIKPGALWRLNRMNADAYGSTRTVCLGTGWTDYMPPPTPATRRLLRAALSRDHVHAARDHYTRDHLNSVGRRAVSTACPTMWSLTPEHCRALPRSRAKSAVFTLTAWRGDPAADRAFLKILRRHYKALYFFPQMKPDFRYMQGFGREDIKVIGASTQAYTRFLQSEEVDFVGTRLHGGIRALQCGRRALILAVDNRAAEIARDTGLPVVARTDLAGIEAWIQGEPATELTLPQEAIDRWKSQFREAPGLRPVRIPPASQILPIAGDQLSRITPKIRRLFARS